MQIGITYIYQANTHVIMGTRDDVYPYNDHRIVYNVPIPITFFFFIHTKTVAVQ